MLRKKIVTAGRTDAFAYGYSGELR